MSAPSASPKINLHAIYLISLLFKTLRFRQEFRAKFGLTSLNVRVTVIIFLTSSVCKLFLVSSAMIIDPSYHIILLSYHPGFDSNSRTIPRKYPGENIPIKSIYRLDLLRCIMRRCKTEKERCCFFYSILDKNGVEKQTNCNVISTS